MDSRHLKHFVSVAEHGHFTMAAKALHIAQPALSISIKKFEQQLGVELFRREERQITLTDEGKVLYEHAKRVLQQIDDAKLAIDEMRGLEKGEVRLGAPSMMGSYFFPQVLMAFKTHYPNLKLTLIDAGARSIRKMLLNGELDIGVIDDENVPDDLETDHLLNVEMVAVVGPEHPLAEKKSISFTEFFEHELVMFKPGYFHRDFVESKARQYEKKMNFSFETNLLPMILSIVKHEFAITALLKLVTEHEKDVVAVPFDDPVNLRLSLAWRKDGYLSIADRTFIEFVKQYV
ncbi:LysR family transcriptional regulator [Vibrio sp. Isolate23]|uniref:LysR family transcriptional regulator n=1 Tax=Vibrio TaxID=662 RepID=UPI001EFCB265|nr:MULTISPECIES: LysR family transcriptional regulator [Vibrio]MCG9679079.1 LysR family transcriptional regulator [Vibrio sp. Isolate24]MCG9682446.1 LysR family transcriptional regulator [Vibrio sp. Isolate23]USD33846.1 LysR family transcriptional regulator [Vibrio sp. SCSIO 43186]USD46946.1 LysR family transcriptional regulator [Vibrio sp. SCSIO 43145]USD70970.1 LysR family transcriptional regulator [Vibrio sp. SCSIO 43139]